MTDRPTCEWFALCTNPAAGTADGPMDGRMTEIPVCSRCANKLELELTPYPDTADCAKFGQHFTYPLSDHSLLDCPTYGAERTPGTTTESEAGRD